MTKKVIAEAWQSYSKEVIPDDAPKVQRAECQRAFYAGAHGLFTSLMKMLDPGEEPTAADLAKVSDVWNELQQFARDVVEGRA